MSCIYINYLKLYILLTYNMYNETIKRAIDNYRKKNSELINEIQRKSYQKHKKDEQYMIRNAKKSQIYRDKIKLKKIEDANLNKLEILFIS